MAPHLLGAGSAYKGVRIRSFQHTCRHVRAHTHTHTHTHTTHTHTHTHTRTETHMHTFDNLHSAMNY